jgi:hypothetical protein
VTLRQFFVFILISFNVRNGIIKNTLLTQHLSLQAIRVTVCHLMIYFNDFSFFPFLNIVIAFALPFVCRSCLSLCCILFSCNVKYFRTLIQTAGDPQ